MVSQRRAGLLELEVHRFAGAEPAHTIAFPDPTYVAYPTSNVDLASSTLRYVYESMTTPASVYDYDLAAGTQTLRKQTEVLGGFDRTNYVSERVCGDGPRRRSGPDLAGLPQASRRRGQRSTRRPATAAAVRLRLVRGQHGRRLQLPRG